LPLRHLTCQLVACEAVGGDVYRVQLRAPAGKPPRYHAGQYLLIEREDGDMAAFSIASTPQQGRELELHILAREASSCSLLEQLQRTGVARLQMPLGDTHLAGLADAPLLLIAAGTGMAQMHSLLEHCRHSGWRQPVHLYWGARQPGDFYRLAHWIDWQQMTNVRLHQVVSDPGAWDGRRGLLHQAICEDFADLRGLQVFASGSPAMVYNTLDALVEAGMQASQMRADVFAYAPRAAASCKP
jgi:CDP-4-dehydro-6-deoxyglucose reductase